MASSELKIGYFNVEKHLSSVLEIENSSFEIPWTEDEFKTYKRTRGITGWVAHIDGEVVGYIFYESKKHHFNVINLAVAKKSRRQGVGSKLLSKPLSKLSADRRNKVRTYVREANLKAQLFLQHCGFIAANIRAECFEDIDEVAYEMVFRHGWPIDI